MFPLSYDHRENWINKDMQGRDKSRPCTTNRSAEGSRISAPIVLRDGKYSQAERPISTGQLKVLLPLHFPPINLVVYKGSSKSKPDWESLSWRKLGA